MFWSSWYGGYSTAGLSQSTCSWKSPGAEADTFTGANEVVNKMLQYWKDFTTQNVLLGIQCGHVTRATHERYNDPTTEAFSWKQSRQSICPNMKLWHYDTNPFGTQIKNLSCRYKFNIADEPWLIEQKGFYNVLKIFFYCSEFNNRLIYIQFHFSVSVFFNDSVDFC